MAARIDSGRAKLLTRTGLDWTGKYPSVIAAMANLKARATYLDGELCGVDDAGLPSLAHAQAASDSERGVRLVYYAFDLAGSGSTAQDNISLLSDEGAGKVAHPVGRSASRSFGCR
jgi:ATP-dependent DNA ligase